MTKAASLRVMNRRIHANPMQAAGYGIFSCALDEGRRVPFSRRRRWGAGFSVMWSASGPCVGVRLARAARRHGHGRCKVSSLEVMGHAWLMRHGRSPAHQAGSARVHVPS
eukprot:SAG31_NODE_27100_length_431_cov_1.045181_1_plen_109_part_10